MQAVRQINSLIQMNSDPGSDYCLLHCRMAGVVIALLTLPK